LSDTLTQVQALVAGGASRISDHGFEKLEENAILARDVLAGVDTAVVVEDYPSAIRGPTVLVLQWDTANRPIHVVWAIPKGHSEPAIVVTAYRPDPKRWSPDYMERKAR
jgi:hypothetical protein